MGPLRPFVAVFGPRGAGKTVLLRQLRAHLPNTLYVSADSLEAGVDLFDLTSRLHRDYGIDNLCMDEIHFIPNYAEQLKRIYDFLPVRVWFTSSVALSLTATGWDLSRRVVSITLLPFTYREYLRFTEGTIVPPLGLRQCLAGSVPSDYLRLRGRFRAYIEGGEVPRVPRAQFHRPTDLSCGRSSPRLRSGSTASFFATRNPRGNQDVELPGRHRRDTDRHRGRRSGQRALAVQGGRIRAKGHCSGRRALAVRLIRRPPRSAARARVCVIRV
ncbi:MAG: AAA family ATPase [Spirochaetes bacterium]|nr:AAA family ATPase [Spirochaetota bacterium]